MKAALLLWPLLLLSSSGKKVRWCTLSDAEQRKCSELSRALLSASAPSALSAFTDVLHSSSQHSRLYRQDQGSCVFSVVVARKGTLDIKGLKGSRSCHSGARWTSGWSLPLGFLLSQNDLLWDKGRPLSHAVSEYFNASCVPGVGLSSPALCALCQGQRSYLRDRNYFCETSGGEPFFDSEGAFRCLRSGIGEVAFVDHLAVLNATESDLDEYELLCPDGSTAPLMASATCHLGRGPGRALLTRKDFRKVAGRFITLAQQLFGAEGEEKARFELFSSAPFRGKDLLFRDATQRLRLVGGEEEEEDVTQVLGLDYVSLLQGLGHEGPSLSESLVRWCCISDAELHKCEEWALNVHSDPLVCIQADSMSGCIERIKKNEADAVRLDATHSYFADICRLVPVAVEDYGPTFAVALAREKGFGPRGLWGLRGRRSCHGYEFSPAGWVLPSRHIFPDVSGNGTSGPCDLSAAYQDFFWKGCMPGQDGGPLCRVCLGAEAEGAGKGPSHCAANHGERYYGNRGALRCLLGDPDGRHYGDVAFVEHHDLLQNIEHERRHSAGGALGSAPSSFVLLCPDGTQAAILDGAQCNLGRVPPGIIVSRPVASTKIHRFLQKFQDLGTSFQLFQSQNYGGSDLLFKDNTKRLLSAINGNFRAIIGEPFFKMAESIFNCTKAGILDFCKRESCADPSRH
nr:PREDICTED: serotransferrin-1 [Anolis carolinensis]XP_016854401.1 PREDICTED: serotransferrin-1 [Anolis carolinensis]|eukprot:XP_016854400.1 PREDICTED: serotransferrin-1 [Anolis carolinensis]